MKVMTDFKKMFLTNDALDLAILRSNGKKKKQERRAKEYYPMESLEISFAFY
jgi:hypothetical protein